ncbi:MarR family transcriptional regulator [Amycolatopsis jiangsuensis]|uniref:DNA-binding transcriptional ArsR family regulator n=1 Tax=Amycolatopsis jiangsuensis TaxID=1181879 RepID=A0A840IMT5_9PSEU|nr:MarR family transcriptional regulator [Amycolatopsis jiangsuensis]MBB4683721.1 DNA-binding transcriptional ArsR family regulator [Amycolatopsis jiangsuensis]
MTPSPPIAPAFQRELDPLLLLPVRLFVLCQLADMCWRRAVVVGTALGVDGRSLAPHLMTLRAAGYLQTRFERASLVLRLTPLGLDRLTEHVTALRSVANTAAELVTARRAPPIRRAVTGVARCAEPSEDGCS